MSFMTGRSQDNRMKNRDVFHNDLEILQSENSHQSMASWFAALQKPFKSRAYTNGGVQPLQHNDTRTSSKHDASTLNLLDSTDLIAPRQHFDDSRTLAEHEIMHPPASGITGQLRLPSEGNSDPLHQRDSMHKHIMEPEDLSVSVQGVDVSDETSNSQRMGSTPSKASGISSQTSLDPTVVKTEAEDDTAVFINCNSSARSSLSSQLSPAKSTTPAGLKPIPKFTAPKFNPRSTKLRAPQFQDLRPRTSIPADLAPAELAHQSIHAAYSSRMNPFALHPNEYHLLRNHICHHHVSAYLNVRNRILRLWVRNPLVAVTAEEAAGCAASSRWLGLAQIAYEWLVRRGYINFGCIEIPDISNLRAKRYQKKRFKRKTIVVVGAGMAGLGCARQLEGLFNHYRDRWAAEGEEVPKVTVLEGRSRIGGRVYSHPLRTHMPNRMPENARHAAEVGAHIITGFDHGNPLSMIIRGQLALHYYPLKDNSRLYDIDGHVVNKERDTMVEKLFNDILDRASVYRHRAPMPITAEGDKEMIEAGREPQGDTDKLLKDTDAERSAIAAASTQESEVESVPGGVDKLTGKAHMVTGPRTKISPALAAKAMGWQLPANVLAYRELNLDSVAKSSKYPTLGAAMDEAVKQYQFLLDLSPQDMRLLNWHYANLEYANAVNVSKLSLGGWDQDIGNEFEGEHTQVIGGYQQVPRAIWQYPTKLDVRTRSAVNGIRYGTNSASWHPVQLQCENGEIHEADHVILTTPLGVLKEGSVKFEPELPAWKLGPIQRLGFGNLNKVILVYDKPFWSIEQDMFGLLRESEVPESLDQEDYVANRGRFYLFWNCIKTTGLPLLIALMAGDAAHQAESVTDAELVAGVTRDLALMFKQDPIPVPIETIVTRWGNDRFARGTYSYVGATSQPGDYEAMAQPIGNLHFAGEATCGTHPATVHGAYISGLRAAAEVIDEILGPIEIPSPLVSSRTGTDFIPPVPSPKRKAESPARTESAEAKRARLEAFESEILQAIFAELGLRPSKPSKASNPFLLFTKENWEICKRQCDEARRAASGKASSKALRDEIRIAVGKAWREASDEVKRPYIERTSETRAAKTESVATFDARLAAWDERAMEIRREFVAQHPGALSVEEELQMWAVLGVYENIDRRPKKESGYAEDSDSEGMMAT